MKNCGLSTNGKAELARLCKIEEGKLAKFLEVGKALVEIDNKRLYLGKHKSFDEFVTERFGICSRLARCLMDISNTLAANNLMA